LKPPITNIVDKIFLEKNCICYKSQGSKILLNALEVFGFFVRNKKLFNKEKYELEIQKEILDLKFKKTKYDLVGVLNETNEGLIKVDFEIKGINNDVYKLDQTQLDSLTHVEYLIIDENWLPISKESIDELQKLIEESKSYFGELKLSSVFNYLGLYSSLYIDTTSINFNLLSEINRVQLAKKDSILKVELYNYQKEGLKWLQFCGVSKIGTILGDDMGLGKTAQVIAFICWAIDVDMFKNFLIVVPSTLLENWRREFLFFTNRKIEPYMHHGANRTGLVTLLKSKKIVITTYSLIINDLVLFKEIKWGAYILDEASLIKNPRTERTKVIKEIPSIIKIAMTGTPVENSLLDLWSISDFCNPGYLGDIESFKEMYVDSNIETNLKNANLETLKDLTSNIMIRRMKEDILDGLPDKIDIHQALKQNNVESNNYENLREEIIGNSIHNKGVIFELIRKLYRYCAHPILLREPEDISFENLIKESKKFERTIEILDEIKVKSEKVLIFTDIIDMIDLLKLALKAKYNIPIYNIDGRIPVSDRLNVIDSFSEQKGFSVLVLNPITAGMGLNIVSANHVIHYTRQWNPALEAQATARAYRNGQKKGVNIYYPFYINTIEEIIDSRLRSKSQLSESVIDTTEDKSDEFEQIYQLLKDKTHE
jgi:SNF2 family DNA or RNA helicase